jgi:hypothetical protein
MNSSNGTLKNEQKINTCTLNDKDLISISSPSKLQNIVYQFNLKSEIVPEFKEIQEKKIENFEIPEEISQHVDFEKVVSGVQEEFKCPICQDLLIDSTTIASCSHTFCLDCLKEWFKTNKNCPVCRKTIMKKPIKNLMIDQYIKSIEGFLSDDELQIRSDRVKEIEEKQNNQMKHLKIAQGNHLMKKLDVKTPWPYETKSKFQEYLRLFEGEVRLKFCEFVGLTAKTIESSDVRQLTVITSNVGIYMHQDNSQLACNKANLKEWIQQDLKWN